MMGAALAPTAALAWDIDRAARDRRLQRAAAALLVSTQESGVGIGELEERSQHDAEAAELLARVIHVAAEARMTDKVAPRVDCLGVGALLLLLTFLTAAGPQRRSSQAQAAPRAGQDQRHERKGGEIL